MFTRVLGMLKGETFLLVLLPVFGWSLSLAFETGILFYYEVPSSFAEVGITQAVFALSISSISIIYLADTRIWTAWWLLTSKKSVVIFKLCLLVIFIIGMVLGIVEAWRDGALFELRGISFMLFLLITMLELFFPKAKKSSPNADAKPSEIDQADEFGRQMFQRLGRPLINVGLAGAAAFALGYAYASGGDEYYVSTAEPNYILVRRYSDTYIFKEADMESLEMRGGIKIQKNGDGKELSLKRVWISSLRNPNRRTFWERIGPIIFGPEKRNRTPEVSYHGPY